jgi:hypothetical protein
MFQPHSDAGLLANLASYTLIECFSKFRGRRREAPTEARDVRDTLTK